MKICIDSSALIFGLQDNDPSTTELLDLLGNDLNLVIPGLIAKEVTRNLKTIQQEKLFYRLFDNYEFSSIIDEPVPRYLVEKYIRLGLPGKADAFIGAFAEWQNISYLISENRHFLRQLTTNSFQVMDAQEFVKLWTKEVKQE